MHRGHGLHIAAAIITTVGLALLVAACGDSASNHTTTVARQSRALAFARCMRGRGVPTYPDPDSSGAFDHSKLTPQQLGVSSSRAHSAGQACQHLLLGGETDAQYVQQLRARTLRLARCMRAHGVTNFPDPGSDGHFPRAQIHALRVQDTPRYRSAISACLKTVPAPGPRGS